METITQPTGNLAHLGILDTAFVDSDKAGLYDGLMAKCLCYYISSRATGDPRHTRQAKKLLSRVQQEIPMVEELGFGDGLAGIGWAVEWLVREGFVDANTDEVLGDIDDTIYTSVVYSKTSGLSLDSGSTGKAFYFLARLEARNSKRKRYRTICLLECLVLLSDEMSEALKERLLESIRSQNSLVSQECYTDIAQSLMIMLRLFKKKINTGTTWESIVSAIPIIEQLILAEIMNQTQLSVHPSINHLIYAYLSAKAMLQKTGFTERSPLISQYLSQMGLSAKTAQQATIDGWMSKTAVKKDCPAGATLVGYLKHIEPASFDYYSEFFFVGRGNI